MELDAPSKMIISDTYNYIFIHVPKCAGTSIRSILSKHDTRNNFYWMHHLLPGATKENNPLPVDKAHMTLSVLKQLYPDDFNLISEYTTFALSRHPRTRLISAFFEPRQKLLNAANAKTDEAIESTRRIFREYIQSLTTNANFLYPAFVHATPQSLFHIYQGKMMTDVVIRVENPNDGLARLHLLNPKAWLLTQEALKTKKNQKNLPDELLLWESLPKDLQRKCADLYQEDCELLGYRF